MLISRAFKTTDTNTKPIHQPLNISVSYCKGRRCVAGGVLDIRRPLPVASAVRVGPCPKLSVTPLGKRNIPQPQDRNHIHQWTLFRLVLCDVFVRAILKMLTTLRPFAHFADFINRTRQKKGLEFKTTNMKMKLSLESGGDVVKTALS